MISDVQDILAANGSSGGANDAAADAAAQRLAQKKSKARRPEGMHRELFALLSRDGDKVAPIVPTLTSSRLGGYHNPKARIGMRRARRWFWLPFKNPARQDELELHHWVREDRLTEPYAFARFNKVVNVLQYADDDYAKCIPAAGWTREATDHLMRLCAQFDLRWPVVHDRWDKQSFGVVSVEDLKERYYSVANALIKTRTPANEEPQSLCFDAEHERRRKEQLLKLWNRTDEQVEEEARLVVEQKKIDARRRDRERKAQDLQKLITAADAAPDSPVAPSSNVTLVGAVQALKKKSSFARLGRPPSGVNLAAAGGGESAAASPLGADGGIKFADLRTQGPHLRSQSTKLPSNMGIRKVKAVEQALERLRIGIVEYGAISTEALAQAYNDLRSEIALLFELKSALANCEFELEALRHRYQSQTGNDFEISERLRVAGDAAPTDDIMSACTSSRAVTRAMDLEKTLSSTRKRKTTFETSSIPKRLRRS